MYKIRGNNERSTNGPKWSLIFIGLSIKTFLIQLIVGPEIWIYFAFFPKDAMNPLWAFRWITSMFLHANFDHLFSNMIALFFFGTFLERLLGKYRFITIYLSAGIIGSIGYLITASISANNIPAIGASGAVYGLLGTLTVLAPFMSVYIWGILPVPMIVLAGIYAVVDITGFAQPDGIAHGAHIAGMLVGIAFGLYLKPFFGLQKRRATF